MIWGGSMKLPSLGFRVPGGSDGSTPAPAPAPTFDFAHRGLGRPSWTPFGVLSAVLDPSSPLSPARGT